MSPEERELQRRNLEEAARRREEAWEKKLEKNRNKKKEDDNFSSKAMSLVEENNPDTLKVIEAAKRREAQVVKQMGFSPFQPHMSFSSGSAAEAGKDGKSSSSVFTLNNSSGSSSNLRSQAGGIEIDGRKEEVLSEDIKNELDEWIDESLGMMLSLAASDGQGGDEKESPKDGAASQLEEGVQLCMSTTLKMLSNLRNNLSDAKFKYECVYSSLELFILLVLYRSIRVNNGAFRSRVASVAGGKELFICAGFVLEFENGEEFLKFPENVTHNQICILDYVITRYFLPLAFLICFG